MKHWPEWCRHPSIFQLDSFVKLLHVDAENERFNPGAQPIKKRLSREARIYMYIHIPTELALLVSLFSSPVY